MSNELSPNTVLVTGAAGFFARHCCECLARLGFDVVGADRVQPVTPTSSSFVVLDLTDGPLVDELIARTRPRHVLHLAGAFGGAAPADLQRDNLLTTLAVLEALRKQAPEAITVVAGSAAEYGDRSAAAAIREDEVCEPVSQYGLSKRFTTEIARYYYRVHGSPVVVVRPFQLIGKGLSPQLAPGAFAEQLRNVARGAPPVLKVGNLSSYRDFLDVRDAAEALGAILARPQPGEIYNVCSGRATRIGDLLELMIRESGLSVTVEQGAAVQRPADASCVFGNHDKITSHCGWTPRRTIEESIASMGLRSFSTEHA
jgi:GDP-4-dehydro-6-deoxy-D-mannose reductase